MSKKKVSLLEKNKKMSFTKCLARLKREDIVCKNLYPVLEVDWPEAISAMNNLHRYFSSMLVVDGVPAVNHIIKAAIYAYDDCRHKTQSVSCDLIRMAAFLNSMISETVEIMNIMIIDGTNDYWCITHHAGLQDWYSLSQGPFTIDRTPNFNTDKWRAVIYDILTLDNIKGILKEFGYEKAVMDGSLATRY